MAKVNIRESLGRIDLLTDNKYDLRNTYDSSNLSNDKKKMLAESISKNASAKQIHDILSEDFEDDDFESEFDARYDVFSYYSNSVSLLDNFYGLEDDLHTDDFEEVKDWVWDKIQRGLYVTAADSKTGNTVSLNPDNYDFDWDDAYRVFDDLEELSPLNEDAYDTDGDSLGDEVSTGLRYKEALEDATKWCNRYKEDYLVISYGYPFGNVAISEHNYNEYPDEYSGGKIVARVKYEDGNAKVLKEEVEEDEEDKVAVFTKSHVDGKTYWHGFMSREDADKHYPNRLKNGSLNESVDIRDSMVAKEFNYTLNYGGKSSDVSSAVIVIPDAVKFDNKLSDLVIYAEDENGKVLNFSSVDEANDWINKYKDTANFHWERDELHASPKNIDEAYVPSDRFIKRDKDILKREISKGKAWDEVLVNLGYECVDPSCTAWSKDTDDGTIVFSFEDFNEEDEIEDKEIHCSMVDNNGNVVSEDSFKVKINESLKEAVEDEVEFDEFEETDFNDGEVQHGDTFIEDGREWTWIERIAGPIHLDFDNWAVWSARDWDYIQEKIKPILLNKENLTLETLTKIYDEAEITYFVVDEDTGFIDWGPVESQTEAQDFLNGKVEDWENDEYDESLKESKELKEWYDYTLFYDDIEDGKSYEYDVDYDKLFDRVAELAVDEEDAPQDATEYLDWVDENFDRLYNKFEYDILEYFYEDAYQDYYDNKVAYADYIQDQRTEDSLLNNR